MKKLMQLTDRIKILLVIIGTPLFFSFTPTLVEKKVLNAKISILLPSAFKLMNESMLNAKYPFETRRPNEVYTNETGTINVAFSLTQNELTQEGLPVVEIALKNQFSKSPNIKQINSELREINNHKFIVFEFVSMAVDTQIYNLMFVTSLNNKMMISTFNCTVDKMAEWQKIGNEIMNSIKIK